MHHMRLGNDRLFFGSIQCGDIFPFTGGRVLAAGDAALADRVVNVDLPRQCTPQAWRDALLSHIVEPLLQFVPDLLVLSAGFDAHAADPLGKGTLNLVEEDFFWATRRLVEAAAVTSAKVVSVLEGGYDPKVLGSCVVRHVEGLL